MSNSLVVVNDKIKYICLLDEFNRLVECHTYNEDNQSLVGSIYMGIIKNKVKGVGGYFVDFGQEKNGFLPIKEGRHWSIGQTVMVQVKKDAYQDKGAKLTDTISLTGEFFVLITDADDIRFSSKLPMDARTKGIRSIVKKHQEEGVGYIVRTQSYDAENEALKRELVELKERYKKLCELANYRPAYAMLNKAKDWSYYLSHINFGFIDSVTVDSEMDKSVLETYITESGLHNQITVNPNAKNQYEIIPKLKKELRRKIWLNNGSYLVIDKTEAMTVIDVNSGKNNAKTVTDKNLLKINLSAASEVMRQLRLRNISGIILVDFIDMNTKGQDAVKEMMEALALDDYNRVFIHGFTKLGLMEISRKRTEAELGEKLKIILDL